MALNHWPQDSCAGIKPPTSNGYFVAQDSLTKSSKTTLGVGRNEEYCKLLSALKQTFNESIGTNFQESAISLCNQGAEKLPSSLDECQSQTLHALWSVLRNSVDRQSLKNIWPDRKGGGSVQTLDEVIALLCSGDGHQYDIKSKIDVNSPQFDKFSIKSSSNASEQGQQISGEALSNQSSVSEPITSTEVARTNKRKFEISDKRRVLRFYDDFLQKISIHFLKALAKAWVNHFHGSLKQRNRRQKDRMPVWWPEEVEYVTPNSLTKRDLVALTTAILQHRHDKPGKDVDSLALNAKEILLVKDFWDEDMRTKNFDEKLIGEVLRVAKIQEDYEKDGIGSSTTIHVDVLTKIKKIRGPDGRKRSRCATDYDTESQLMQCRATDRDPNPYVRAIDPVNLSQIKNNSISVMPHDLRGRCDNGMFTIKSEDGSFPVDMIYEHDTMSIGAEDVYGGRRKKRQMRYCGGSQIPESRGGFYAAVVPAQEAMNKSILDVPPCHAYRKEQRVKYEPSMLLESAGRDTPAVSVNLAATKMPTSSEAGGMTIDLTSNDGSNCYSNTSGGTNGSDSECGSNSYWMSGNETNMAHYQNFDGLASSNLKNDEIRPLGNEIDCLADDNGFGYGVGHFNVTTKNDNAFFSAGNLQRLDGADHALHNYGNIYNDQFAAFAYPRLPLCSTHAFCMKQQQEQLSPILQQRDLSYTNNDSAALQNGYSMVSFGRHSDVNDMSILTSF